MSGIWKAAVFVLTHAWATDRRRLLVASSLMALGYVSAPLVGVGLGALTDAALAHEVQQAVWLGLGVAALLISELMMGHFAHLSYFELGDLQQMRLADEVAEIAHSGSRIDRFDQPEFTKRVTVVTEGLLNIRGSLESTLQLGGLTVQVLITTAILGFVEPWLALLPLAALPPVWLAQRAQQVMNAGREGSAAEIELTRHLVRVATTGSSAKEVRLFDARALLVDRLLTPWRSTTSRLWSAGVRAAGLRAFGQVWFALAYGGAVLLVVLRAAAGQAQVGEVVLVVTLAVQVSTQVAGALALLEGLQGVGRTVSHIEALRGEHLGSTGNTPTGPGTTSAVVPSRLNGTVRFEDVTFTYPGKDTPVLAGVTLEIPAGTSVALVGENGAGKSTFVKLLCGLYQPTSGRILVDGVDLTTMPQEEWQSRVATLFQDFARLELLLRENVGAGRIAAVADDDALWSGIDRAHARKVVERTDGLDQLLGHSYGNGTELSGGQWQTLGLARTMLRTHPLLLVLDEPASALDATAEHALFERFVASAQDSSRAAGAITLFVSHRFSTVRDAAQIVVLNEGVVHEYGTHDQLITNDGLYAELFALQAGAYT